MSPSSLLDRTTRLYEQGSATTGPCPSKSATSYFCRRCGRLGLLPIPVPTPVVTVPVLFDFMDEDTDTPVGAAANPRAHVRSVTGENRYSGGRLRNEDEVALRVSRHRVRPGGLRNGFNQNAGAVYDAEHGRLLGRVRTGCRGFAIPVGGRVVAPVALVEPDLIGADDVADVGKVLGRSVDDQRGRVARVVRRSAAQQQIVMWSDGSAVRAARVQRHNAGVRRRIEGAYHRGRCREHRRIDYQQPAVAGYGAGVSIEIAACRIVGDDRNRHIETLGLRVPCRLLYR